jgi:hypothetical protein
MKAHTRFLAVMAAGLLFAGCTQENKNPIDTQEEPPALPPTASMRVDLDFFNASGRGMVDPAAPGLSDSEAREAWQRIRDAASGASPAAGSISSGTEDALTAFHWWNAVLRLVAVRVFVDAALTPPYLAFAAALHSIPTRQPDGSWIWVYTWVQGPERVQLELRGVPEGAKAYWEMRVTNANANPPLDRTLWFSGETQFGNAEGYWLFNDLSRSDFPELVRIEWEVQENGDSEIRAGCVLEGSPEYGDRLGFVVEGVEHAVRYHDESEQLDSEILWNSKTGAGSILVPDYNGGARGCWNEQRQDTVCPGPEGRAR